MTNIQIPDDVLDIIKVLNSNSFEAYIVGGCVRDSLLHKTPKDWDISTSAKPNEVKQLFPKTVDTGIKHGTVTVVINGVNYEITTYREKTHGFSNSLAEDLGLRDFTMNAIAFHPMKGFQDPFYGIQDIHKGIIRAVRSADERFKEDPLRMLRAIRFSSSLGFDIDDDTFRFISKNSHLIQSVSQERIRDELTKILTSKSPMNFLLLKDTGLLQYCMPEFLNCFQIVGNHSVNGVNVSIHSLNGVNSIENNPVLRWTMLLHDIEEPFSTPANKTSIQHTLPYPQKRSTSVAERILKRLKFDSKTIEKVCLLIQYHDLLIEPAQKSVRKAMNLLGEDVLDLVKVRAADIEAQAPEKCDEKLNVLADIKDLFHEIKNSGQCVTIKDLALDGNDLIQMGIPPGKEIGNILKSLMNEVLENPELNQKDVLLQMANRLAKNTQ